jgi:hypothetical protein
MLRDVADPVAAEEGRLGRYHAGRLLRVRPDSRANPRLPRAVSGLFESRGRTLLSGGAAALAPTAGGFAVSYAGDAHAPPFVESLACRASPPPGAPERISP